MWGAFPCVRNDTPLGSGSRPEHSHSFQLTRRSLRLCAKIKSTKLRLQLQQSHRRLSRFAALVLLRRICADEGLLLILDR